MTCSVLALMAPARPAGAVEIVVPAYFYPGGGSSWPTLTAAAATVDVTAIMNPNSGPGAARDNNYVNAVNAFRAAGGRAIGYVHTSYGSRPLANVVADIDKYAAWYALDGIFIDGMANTGPAQRLDYYKAVYEHVKSIDADWEVMGNPGTTTIEQYLTWPAADRLMVFENVGAQYAGYAPSAWNANYDRARFVHLIHTEPSAATMEAHLQLAVERNAGGVYVTDDVLGNPWDRLPEYWDAEVARVAALSAAFDAADFNEDGHVDGDDLARFRAGFGRSGAAVWRRDGDANGDNVVDGADFLIWQQSLSDSESGDSTATSAVAEPSGLSLGAAATVLAASASRRAWLRTLNRIDTMDSRRGEASPGGAQHLSK
jgi:hypothetical protein